METAEGSSTFNWQTWLPKSFVLLREYNRKKFLSDLIAGITVGLVALPLAMAFAISSGVPPQSGIYCAVVAGFLISALGGSKTQIGGPTGAFVVIVGGIVLKYGIEGLYIVTGIAGVLLVIMGITGFGSAVKFIPRPVVLGFTNGIAVLIASTQIKDFCGLKVDHVAADFWGRMETLAAHWHTFSWTSLLLSAGSLAVILITPKLTRHVPGTIVALFAGTLAAALLKLPVETIGTRFGGIPSGLPHLEIPTFHLRMVPALLGPALTVAMLGAIESLMSAVVSDRMSGDKHNPNVELVAQGIANIASPMFGGLPATGAIARTATNIRSGAKSPLAGMIHALTLLAILLFAAPAAKFIPLPVLAAILMMVSYNMGEWREVPEILKLTKSDISVWIVTFLLTVFADLTVAVEAGMILATLLFIRKVTMTTTISEVTDAYVDAGRVHILQDKTIPDYLRIFRIHGPFLFGATEKIAAISDQIDELPAIVILRLRNMTAIDATGLKALEDVAEALHKSGRTLILCGAREQPAMLMRKAEFEEHVGPQNICPNVEAALARAEQVYEEGAELRKQFAVAGVSGR
ncbi:MAG TPA: SulP family inorganic anion transporter [Terriglobales bacterium]|nr:SulP family inorganic anion transporter [Terriglobales bacterium]